MTVPSITINKVCLSGLNAIALADQLIRAGEVEIVVAGGMESMTQAPHLLPKSRDGFKYGDVAIVDSMAYDGLCDQSTDQAMGRPDRGLQRRRHQAHPRGAGRLRRRSHQQAAAAWKNGVFDDEVVPVEIPQRKGDPSSSPRTRASAATPPPSRSPRCARLHQGRHHHRRLRLADLRRRRRRRRDEQGQGRGARAGVARRDRRPRHGRRPRLDPAAAAGERHRRPAPRRASTLADIDLFELNEAFAAVGIESARALGAPRRVNVNGGAIAVGHPVGMSGARIVLHLALELKRRGGGVGAAALCGGGGQGDALIVRVP